MDMLAAVEKLSFRRGQDDDVSLFAIEDVPSFNCFAIFRFPSIALPLLTNLIEKLARPVPIDIYFSFVALRD